jgi:hypothetical protein
MEKRLNLQSVNRVFIVEPQWNPSVESQAIARAIRLGQEQQVLVTRYRVEDSIEEVSEHMFSAFESMAWLTWLVGYVLAADAEAGNQ